MILSQTEVGYIMWHNVPLRGRGERVVEEFNAFGLFEWVGFM